MMPSPLRPAKMKLLLAIVLAMFGSWHWLPCSAQTMDTPQVEVFVEGAESAVVPLPAQAQVHEDIAVPLAAAELLDDAVVPIPQAPTAAATTTPAELAGLISDRLALWQLTLIAIQQGVPVLDAPRVAAAAGYWVWGLPLLIDAVACNSTAGGCSAVNRYTKLPFLLNATNQIFSPVATPNADTLYMSAALDLSQGPVVLTAPNTNGRYYVLQLLDAWHNTFGNPGAPTTGTAASSFVVLPPSYDPAKLPLAYRQLPSYMSNTTAAIVLGRVYVNKAQLPTDLLAAVAALAAFNITTLSTTPPTAVATAFQQAVDLLKAASWRPQSVVDAYPAFRAIAGLATAFPGPPATALPDTYRPVLLTLGIDPRKGFNQTSVTAKQASLLKSGAELGNTLVRAGVAAKLGKRQQTGWTWATNAGAYGNAFLTRAGFALGGTFANIPQVTVYAFTNEDDLGVQLNGADGANYTITFLSNRAMTAEVFSSLTAYSKGLYRLMANPFSSRVNINFQTTPLQMDTDGSLTIYISVAPPGPPGSWQHANWLPIGPQEFFLTLRIYGPDSEQATGILPLPVVHKV